MVIWTKLSDIVGRRTAISSALFIFVAFSAECGAAVELSQTKMVTRKL